MKRSSRLLLAGAGVALAAGLMPSVGAVATVGPAGNNGTVKIDGVDFDSHPDNEPHVGCRFQVDWYGFDGGATSDVTFELQAPTGSGVIKQDSGIKMETADNAGGGSEAGLDASVTYGLAFPRAVKPHPIQGYHVKLTINTTGAQGADVKHKVFWVEGCYGSGGY
jgi:hypothetical protein